MLATETRHFHQDSQADSFTFDNWYDYVALAESGETNMEGSNRASRGKHQEESWDKNAGFQGAIKLARDGWAEGTALLHDEIRAFESLIPAKRLVTEIAMDVMGPGVLDFGRWATGHPEAWMVQRERETTDNGTGRVIRVVFNISATSNVRTSEIMKKGATVVGLIDLLERSGKRVELDLVCGATGGRGREVRTQVRIKDAGAPLDIERIAFAIAHPASLRRLAFSIWELATPTTRGAAGIGGGYGSPVRFTVSDGIYIDALDVHEFRSEAGRLAWVTEQLTAQGVVFED